MKLNKWPYWLKGGLFAVALPLVAQEIFHAVTGNYPHLPLQRLLRFLPDVGSDILTPLFCHQTGEWGGLRCLFVPGMLISDILLLLQFFILGAFLGWLYGKIKNRKATV